MLCLAKSSTTVKQLATAQQNRLLLFSYKKPWSPTDRRMVSSRQENGLQQTGEWSPRFWLQATFLSTSYFHTWAIILQRLYHQEQLITVGKKNIYDILTDSYIRDHRKNGLQDNLKRTDYEWSVLPI
ncbi:hypothetical protein QL285_086912 [Trifolium repens]|nr:hypothetical protein QL285_086912 [Trifolium repens]